MEVLIQRVRQAQGVLGISDRAREAIHFSIVVEGKISEEDFFLAWNAAQILEEENEKEKY